MTAVTRSTTHAFDELGYPDAAERQIKTRLALAPNELLKRKKLKQREIADLLGVPQPKVSAAISELRGEQGTSVGALRLGHTGFRATSSSFTRRGDVATESGRVHMPKSPQTTWVVLAAAAIGAAGAIVASLVKSTDKPVAAPSPPLNVTISPVFNNNVGGVKQPELSASSPAPLPINSTNQPVPPSTDLLPYKISGLRNVSVFAGKAKCFEDNSGCDYAYESGRRFKISAFYNQVKDVFRAYDETSMGQDLDFDFEGVWPSYPDDRNKNATPTTERMDSQIVFGQYNFSGENPDSLVILTSRQSESFTVCGINIYRLENNRWKLSGTLKAADVLGTCDRRLQGQQGNHSSAPPRLLPSTYVSE